MTVGLVEFDLLIRDTRHMSARAASIRTTADIYGHLDFDAVADKLSGFTIEGVA